MSNPPSLLPPNATPLEKNIETSTARMADLPLQIRDVWNPATCPVALLPWLAWAMSVDTWNSSWPESVQRQVIASSVQVHRMKGTPRAVMDAIAAIDHNVTVSEWFEHGGDPYTFRGDVELPATGIQDAELVDIERLINSAKNVRSHFTHFRLYSRQQASTTLLAASVAADSVTVYPA